MTENLTIEEIEERLPKCCTLPREAKDNVPLTQEQREVMSVAFANGEDDKTLFNKMTCDECPLARRCNLAWDPYNTGGDCLASK